MQKATPEAAAVGTHPADGLVILCSAQTHCMLTMERL